MRIDKYLKVSRLIKRREIAKRLCDDGDIKINGKVAKAATEVEEGDTLELMLGRRIIVVKVKAIRPFTNKENAAELYEIVSDSNQERNSDDD